MSDRRNPLSWLATRGVEAVDIDDVLQNVDIDAVVQRIDVDALVERIDLNAVVGRIDPNVLLEQVDANALLDRIDPNALIERLDLDAVVGRIDADALVRRVDADALIARVDADALLERADPNALLDRVDPDRLLDRVDPNRLLDRVAPDRLLDRVDPNQLLDRVEPDRLLDRVDADRLLDRVDPNRLLDRVEPDRLLDRVDPNQLLDRVDPNPLLDKVDPNALADRLDVQKVVDRMDVAGLVERAGVADIVRDSTGAVAGSLLDVVRRQLIALDAIVERLAYRILRRDPNTRPAVPDAIEFHPTAPAKDGRGQVSGHYAGPVSRTVAFLLDALVVFWVFTAVVAALSWIAGLFGYQSHGETLAWILTIAFWVWAFFYWFVGLSLTGRTVGKAVVGLKVMDASGHPLKPQRAVVRTLVEPISFLLLALGVLVVLVNPRRQALHDRVARTCEIYDWGDRPAELPAPLTAWIHRRTDDEDIVGERTETPAA